MYTKKKRHVYRKKDTCIIETEKKIHAYIHIFTLESQLCMTMSNDCV